MSNEESSSSTNNQPDFIDLTDDDDVQQEESTVLENASKEELEDALRGYFQPNNGSGDAGNSEQEEIIGEVVVSDDEDEEEDEEEEEVIEESGEDSFQSMEELKPLDPEEIEVYEIRDSSPESDIIIEAEIVVTDAVRAKKRALRAREFLSWFTRLRPEQFENINFTSPNYREEAVTEGPVLDLELCKRVAEAYKESGDLEGLVEKFELKNEEMAVVAICMGVLEADNSLNIPFSALVDDRIDEWTLEHAQKFFDQVNPSRRPLQLLKYTLTSPSQCILMLTIVYLQGNNLPCDLEFPQPMVVDGPPLVAFNDLPQMIMDTAIKHWHEQPECGNVGSEFSEFFREIDTTNTELRHQMDRIHKERDINIQQLDEFFEDEPPKYDLLTQKDREEMEKSLELMQKMKEEMEQIKNEAKQVYDKKPEFIKLFNLSPGDYCLARPRENDTLELQFAVVLEKISATQYRVQFLKGGVTMVVNIRDLAMLHNTILHPVFLATTYIGLRVAVLTTVSNDPKNASKPHWISGIICGRPASHKGDFLVFLDNGVDDYVTSPKTPGDPNYDIASIELVSGEAWDIDVVREKIEALKIVLMMGQPADEKGEMDKRRASVWLRDPSRAVFLNDFMKAYPEWPLLRTPKGAPFTIYNSLMDRTKSRVTVLDTDRSFAYVRYNQPPQIPGYDCVKMPCDDKNHMHRDEKVYRGSHRLELVAQKKEMLTTNNNLSRRRKGQFASQFEPTEMERSMPQRRPQNNQQNDTESSSSRRAPKESQDQTENVINNRKKRQMLFSKIINHTPKLKPLSELKHHETCGPDCLQGMDSDPYDEKFHKCSPLHTPLMSGWRRQKISLNGGKKRSQWKKVIMYHAPCGKPLQEMSEIADYLRDTRSALTIDCFSFDEDVETETYIVVDDQFVKTPDFAGGIEGIPIPCVNSVDADDPPQMEYSKRRCQYNETVDISSITKNFCSGCTCDGDCSDASKCECQQLSMQEMKLLPKNAQFGEKGKLVAHYENRALMNKLITGMYECNDQCSCKRSSCHNRVVQNNIKYPMHIFKTAQSGWGVRALTDIPAGAFICNYVGALLTNDLADELKNDDIYFADLDLKDAVETHKMREDNETDHGFAEDSDFTASDSESDREDPGERSDKPIVMRDKQKRAERNIQTRQGRRRMQEQEEQPEEQPEPEQPVGAMFNWDEYFQDFALYVVDAKLKGNLGRFLNHSCDPNVQVQHVMYDTHDLRLPWVSFFTTRLVRAGDELCWDYAYTVLNEDDERLTCNCGSAICRRRLL